jgi:hypothetical protein
MTHLKLILLLCLVLITQLLFSQDNKIRPVEYAKASATGLADTTPTKPAQASNTVGNLTPNQKDSVELYDLRNFKYHYRDYKLAEINSNNFFKYTHDNGLSRQNTDASIGGTYNYSHLIISENRITNENYSVSLGSRFQKLIPSQLISGVGSFLIGYSSDRFRKENKFTTFYINYNTSLDFNNNKNSLLGSPTDNDARNARMGLDMGIGLGNGRLEDISYLTQAMFLLEDMLKNDIIKSYGPVEIEALAKALTKIRYERIIDYRQRYMKEATVVDETLQNLNIVKDKSIRYYVSLHTNLQYNFNYTRNTGTRWSAGVFYTGKYMHNRTNTSIDTFTHLSYNTIDDNIAGLFGTYAYQRPLTLHKHLSLTSSLKISPDFYHSNNLESTLIVDSFITSNTLNNRIFEYFTLAGNYYYAPTFRDLFSFSILYANSGSKQLNKTDPFGISQSSSLNLSYSRWLSENLQYTFATSYTFMKTNYIPGSSFNGANTTGTFYIGGSIRYVIY